MSPWLLLLHLPLDLILVRVLILEHMYFLGLERCLGSDLAGCWREKVQPPGAPQVPLGKAAAGDPDPHGVGLQTGKPLEDPSSGVV